MLVVVASHLDEKARSIAARWKFQRAALLTCEDLSTSGWKHYLNDLTSSTAVVSGQIVPIKEITGVITRRPAMLKEEFVHIAPGDREYVAAEMNAFLVSWLASLTCPVLNPPTATCLSGPNWRIEQWIYAAAQCDIPVFPQHRHIPLRDESSKSLASVAEVTIVGDRWFGAVDETLVAHAQRLAHAAGVNLLSVRFSNSTAGAHFLDANLFPEITGQVAGAILEFFQNGVSR